MDNYELKITEWEYAQRLFRKGVRGIYVSEALLM